MPVINGQWVDDPNQAGLVPSFAGSSGGSSDRVNLFENQLGEPGKGLGGYQITGAGGVGAGLQSAWYGSDISRIRNYGLDLRNLAPQWVPQVLETTPEAQTLFDKEAYGKLMQPMIEQGLQQMMGGYRTSLENIRRGLAARGLSGSSSLAPGLMAQGQASMLGQFAGARNTLTAQAGLQQLQQALQYRQGIVGLGLGVPQAQYEQKDKSNIWGSILGSVAGVGLGALTGGLGAAAGGALASSIFGGGAVATATAGPLGAKLVPGIF